MKKNLFLGIACLLACVSCSEDEVSYDPRKTIQVTEGAYIINQGNYYSGISGTLTYHSYTEGTTTQKAFATANGRALGATPNDGLIYGGKLYIVVSDEQTVEIVDRRTLRSVRQLRTSTLGEKGGMPRKAVAQDGKVYVSMFSGYVAVIDTASCSFTGTLQAGSYPEGMTILNNNLYVANSDYGNVTNASLSRINLSTGESTLLRDSCIINPVAISSYNGNLYILDSGTYDANWCSVEQGVRKMTAEGEVTRFCEGTFMALADNRLYTINCPYTIPATIPSYWVYDLDKGTKETFIDGTDVVTPCAIAADPVSDHVIITSYVKGEYGYADYNANGYALLYDKTGQKISRWTTGVTPCGICFSSTKK